MHYVARPRSVSLAVLLVAALAWCVLQCTLQEAANAASPFPLRLVKDVPVKPVGTAFAGQTPRMDYETIDSGRRVLYIAYLGADEVIAFNVDSNKVVAHIPNLPRVHGIIAISKLHRLYASATGADQIVAIDEGTLQITARVAGGEYPDGIAYDPDDHKVFVSDEHGTTDSVVDTNTNKTLTSIDVGGEAGNTQYDPKTRRVFTDVQTRNDLVAIDPATDRVVARYPLPGCDHDHGLLLDAAHRLAFVSCDGNAKLLVVSMDTWKELAIYPVGDDPDVMALDEGMGRLYVAAESGIVAVFQENGNTLHLLGKAFVAREAHTVAVDPVTHRVYFALENVAGRPVVRVMTP